MPLPGLQVDAASEMTLNMSRRGTRSRTAHLQRVVARIVSKAAHRDYRKSESVNLLTEGQVLSCLLDAEIPGASIGELIPASEMFGRGEVISDSRGQGSQQQVTVLGS